MGIRLILQLLIEEICACIIACPYLCDKVLQVIFIYAYSVILYRKQSCITAVRDVLKLTTLNGVTSPEIQLAGAINNAPNLLTESSAGLLVDGDMVGATVAESLGQAEFNANIYRYDDELNAIRHNVNGNELQIPQIKILNSKGELVGLIDDMETGTTVYSAATPLDYSPFQ